MLREKNTKMYLDHLDQDGAMQKVRHVQEEKQRALQVKYDQSLS